MPPSIRAAAPPSLAQEIARADYLSRKAHALVPGLSSAREFLDRLEAEELLEDAVNFRARQMTRRMAVWWGCLCVWYAVRAKLSVCVEEAVRSASYWVADPDEPNRRRAAQAAEAAGLGTPGGLLAIAAFLSGGSVADPKLPAAAPPPDGTAKAVGGAVFLAAAVAPDYAAAIRQFIALGRDVETGRIPFPPSRPSEAASAAPAAPAAPSRPDRLNESLGQSLGEDASLDDRS